MKMNSNSKNTTRTTTIIALSAVMAFLCITICMMAFAAEKVPAAEPSSLPEKEAPTALDIVSVEEFEITPSTPAPVNFTFIDEELTAEDNILWYASSFAEIESVSLMNPSVSYQVKATTCTVTEIYDEGTTVEFQGAYYGLEEIPNIQLGDEVVIYFLMEA